LTCSPNNFVLFHTDWSGRFNLYIISHLYISPLVLSPFRGGGIVYLSDPDSYAGWSFYTPGRVRQSSSTVSSFSLLFSLLYFPILLLFLFFPCFTRLFITFLRCSDVKPLSLTLYVSTFSDNRSG